MASSFSDRRSKSPSRNLLLYLFLWCSLTPAGLWAQSYSVAPTGSYNIEINDPTYVYFDEDDSEEMPIGFDFDFFGQTYTDCWVGSDGFVAFGSYPGGGCCGQEIPDPDPLNNLIAVAWTNMDWHSVHYEVFGSAPFRRCVITFDLRDVCDVVYYGQVKLYETTNVIEIHTQEWGYTGGGPCNNTTQGLEGPDGTEAVYLAGRNFNSDWYVDQGDDDVVTFTPDPGFYTLSQTGDYAIEIDDPTYFDLEQDDITEIPIGFTFSFYGNPYTTCFAGGDGFITFTNEPGDYCCGQALPDPSTPNNLIACAWSNMDFTSGHYEVFGDAPFRRCVITFDLANPCDEAYYGQIKLFETTNVIEIHTESFEQNNCQNVWTATQGIENIDGTQALFVPGRNALGDWQIQYGDDDFVSFTPAQTSVPYDVGISYIPDQPLCEGEQYLGAFVNNFGVEEVTSFTLEWEFDNVPQDPVYVNTTIPGGGEYYFFYLDTVNLVAGQTYPIKVWTSMPNGTPDQNPANDTMSTTITVGLHGTYTIGGSSPDYATFGEAISDLQLYGVCDTTTFNVRPGTYNEQVIVPNIPGVFLNPVTFQAENGDSSSVILQYAATQSDSNFTLRFNSAYHICWQNMTLKALGAGYARVIELTNYSINNKIRHCYIEGKNTTSNAGELFCVLSKSINEDNLFFQNTIRYGSSSYHHENQYGEIFGGLQGGGANRDIGDGATSGLAFIQNNFLDFADRGIYTQMTQGIQIRENVFQSSKNNAVAIDINTDSDTLGIAFNDVYLAAGSYGIRLQQVSPPSGTRCRMYNNIVNVGGTNVQQAVRLVNCDRLSLYDNTIRINLATSGRYALYHSGGMQDTLYNNIAANLGGGRVIFGSSTNQNDIDYNDLYVTGSLFGQFNGTAVANLMEWQTASGFDEHSLDVDPFFVSATDLHVSNSFLNASANPAFSDAVDFDRENRNAVTPDIGADEFTPVSLDAALIAVLSPTLICENEQAIEVVLKNLGADTLTQVTLQWTLNGIQQPDVIYSQPILPEGDTAHIIVQQFTFTNHADSIRIWCAMPNGETDMQQGNDTVGFRFRLPLNGVYTVGGSSPDFATITEAVSDLNTFHTCGPVTIRIRDGIYTEQLVLDSIPTVDEDNPLVFESESLDSSAVTIQYTPTNILPSVFLVKGTDYVTFRYLGFKSLASSWADGLELRYSARHIHITHCYFDIYNFGSSSIAIKSLCFNSPRNEYLTIDHNYFYQGQQAIYIYNCGNRVHDIVVDNNTFYNQRFRAMDLSSISGLYVRNNTMTTTATSGYTGIDLSSSDMITDISGNLMTLASGDGMFLDGMNFSIYEGNASIYNNMVKTASSGNGIRVWNSEDVFTSFNTVFAAGSGIAYEIVGGGDTTHTYNNVFVSQTGKAVNYDSYGKVYSDYNDLLTISGATLGTFSATTYADLPAWISGTMVDSNSMEIDPEFVSATDLHVLADTLDGAGIPIAGITIDIDGNPRNALTPDIGADEIGANDNDAGVLAILPEMPFARGLQPVKAVVRNFGGNTLTSVEIHWTLNDVAQSTFAYTGSLPSLQQDTVVLGIVDFSLSTAYAITAWTADPNGGMDLYNSNDTLHTGNRYAAVSDTLTIGGASPDLANFAAALTAMTLGGILDSVHFQLRTGTYHEILVLPHTLGMDCNTPVVFESESGNAADVIWDNSTFNTHTLYLNSADGVVFKNLTIKTIYANYHAVEFENGATCNSFLGCILEGVTTTSSSSTQATVYSNGGGNVDNRFIGNTFKNGSYNLCWIGDLQTTGALVKNNTFQNAYYSGIYVAQLKAPVIEGNTVTSNTSYIYYYGIYVYVCTQHTHVLGNEVNLPGKRGVGITLSSTQGDATHRVIVANNFVLMGNGTYSYGLFVANGNYLDVDYNTVRMTGGDPTGSAFLRNYTPNIDLRNNIFDNRSNGTAMAFSGNEGPLTSDYNDLLTTGTYLVSINGQNFEDLLAWQEMGLDTNSISEDPMYVSSTGYAVTSAALNSVGQPIAWVTSDIDGEPRDTLTPDIGCDEFFLATNDVGILSINYPVKPFPEGENTVFIKFVNNGQDTLTSMQVDWAVDGHQQPAYMWTGLLPSAGTYDSLDVGVYDFAPYMSHTVTAWVSLPNGVPDELASNDTLVVDSLYPGLSGIYTIGGVNPDFDSIGIAVRHLNLGGAAGPVTLNIRTGTYLETINLEDFPGSDCDRPVIFQSEAGDSSAVVITNLGLDDNIISLNGTDGVIFHALTLKSVNPAYRNVIDYSGGAHCNQFTNDHIIGYESNSTNSTDAVILSGNSLDTANVFLHNTIQFGSRAFYLTNNGEDTHTRIEGNILDRNYQYGLYASSESALRILGNTFHGSTYTYYQAIYLEYCQRDNRIEGNDIQATTTSGVINIQSCQGSMDHRARIANNFISGFPLYNAYGLQINNCKRYDVWFNNIYLEGGQAGNALSLTSDSSIHLLNNIIMNGGPGLAVAVSGQSDFSSDYNDFYGNQGFASWDGGGLADLAAWQTASGEDAHSHGVNPQFMSGTNLHVTNIILNAAGVDVPGIETDIDGDSRNTPPDIGADEFDPAIANDAGIFSYMGPNAPFASGVQPVTVTLKNYGYETLTSADIRWLVNGVEQGIYHWTGSLAPVQCDTVVVGNFNFQPHSGYDMIFWDESPNGLQDSTHVNDTLEVADIFPALIGIYTVGGVLPDFNVFAEVEEAINKGGILGNVTFNVRNGTYSTQFSLQDFPRISYNHKVTFQSESGDSSTVTIVKDFVQPQKNYTVACTGAHNIEFNNLTLSSTQGRVVDIGQGASRINIHNCKLTGVNISYYSNLHQVIYSGTTSEDSISVQDNRIERGDVGIMLQGSNGDPEQYTFISGNTIVNPVYRAMLIQNVDYIQIKNNVVLSEVYPSSGIVLTTSRYTGNISGNDIRLLAGGQYGMSLYDVKGTSGTPTLVANNYILIRNGNSGSYGLAQNAGDYNNFYHNTIRIENQGSVAFYDGGSYQHINIRNSLFSNTDGGLTFYANWVQGYNSNTMDYCNLYTTGPVIAYYASNYADLIGLQGANAQNQHSVSAEPLYDGDGFTIFQSACDSAAVPLPTVLTDIEGESRDATYPDIGCDEFVLLAHDIGPKLLVTPQTYCGLTNAEEIVLRIQNFGASPETGFNVAYSRNGGSWHSENVGALVIPPGGTLDYTFTTTEDLTSLGTYSFDIYTALGSDLKSLNDTIFNIEVENLPALSAPVSNMIPVDGTVDLNKTVSLSWAPAPDASLYDIYIWPEGNAQPSTPSIEGLSTINTLYDVLNYGTTYNWQVVARNLCDQMIGSVVQQFTIRQLPDILVDTVYAPPTAFSGQQIQVDWTVRNLGPGDTQDQLWSDAVYLSTDATLNVSYDTYLGAVQNLSALDSNGTYNNTGFFTIPNGFVGNYYVFVYADRWNSLIESNNNNNWTRTSAPMMISLTPAPDLVVDQVLTPTTAFSGVTIPVTYIVHNQGAGDAPSNVPWTDRLIFGTDPFNAIGTVLLNVPHTQGLESDSSYTMTVNVMLPQAIFGTYYMHVVTDVNNSVYEFAAENNNSNASLPIDVILSPPADLVMTAITFPDTVSNGQLVPVSWTVENNGAGPTTAPYWLDQIYLSTAPVYNPNFLINFAQAYINGPIAPFDQYTQPVNVYVPANASGHYYLYGYTDKQNHVFEFNMEGNNSFKAPQQIFVANADIIATHFVAPDTALFGSSVNITWKTRNSGAGHVFYKSLVSKVYLSTTPSVTAQSLLLAQQSAYVNDFKPGDSLARSSTFSLPEGLLGDYYILVQSDAQNAVYEGTGESNNVTSHAIYLTPGPVPDLVTTTITAPDTMTAGILQDIQYTYTNQGTATVSTGWTDKIYFSFSPTWNPDFAVELKSISQPSGLAPGVNRILSVPILIPQTTTENVYYFYIVNDVTDLVFEGLNGNTNNISRSDSVYVKASPPVDIAMDSILVTPTTLYSGVSFPFQWKAKNVGASTTLTTAWTDRIYLSLDTILQPGLDILLTDRQSQGALLAPDQTRTTLSSVMMPNGISGMYYIIGVTDALDVHMDVDRDNNVNLVRDVSGDPQVFNVILSPSPDLTITLFNTPATAIAGQPLQFIYTIHNGGNGAAAAWVDKLYLSTDNTISYQDIVLLSAGRVNLAAGNSISDTVEVQIPVNYYGNYILILQTDASNQLYEHNGENNNILTRTINIINPPPSDLQVQNVVVPVSVIAGENITLSWTTKNIGVNPASGQFREIAYISADTTWSTDDVVFGFKDQYAYLPPGGQISQQITDNVIGVATGDYYAIIQTDARQNINETNETNNFTASAETMNVDVNRLYLDSLTLDSLTPNQELYYKLIIGPELDGETVLLDLTGDSINGLNELYVKFDQMPTRANFDIGFQHPFESNQQIIIPDVHPGTYYILVYGFTLNQTIQPISLFAKVIDYEILSLTPDHGVQNTQVTVKIIGTKLNNTSFVELRRSEPWFSRQASSMYIVNDNLAFATFDLTDVPIDTFAVDMIKADSSLAYIDNFEVVADGRLPRLQINADLPGAAPSRNSALKMVLSFINNGEADFINPEIRIDAPYGNKLSMTLEGLPQGDEVLIVPLVEENGPPGVIRPGASGRIEVYGYSGPVAVYGIRINN